MCPSSAVGLHTACLWGPTSTDKHRAGKLWPNTAKPSGDERNPHHPADMRAKSKCLSLFAESSGALLWAQSLSRVRLCNPMDRSLPGSSVHGIPQARLLEWVAIFNSRGGLPDPGIEPKSLASPALAGGFFTTSAPWEAPANVYLCVNGEVLYLKSRSLENGPPCVFQAIDSFLFFNLFLIGIITLQCCVVSAIHQHESATSVCVYIYIYPLPPEPPCHLIGNILNW